MSDKSRRTMPLADFDPADIAPTPVKVTPEVKLGAEEAGRAAGFTQRHAPPPVQVLREGLKPAATVPAPGVVQSPRRGRRRFEGRTEQFTVRLKPETMAMIYEAAERRDARAIAEVVEEAFADLMRKIEAEGKGP